MDDTPKRQQLVSVVTPTHNIGSMILRAYDSLSSQTYGEWEWVLYDDSTDEETAGILKSIARSDHRVRVHRGGDHSGVVGEVKRRGFSLAEGDIILELDHDDELIETCIEQVVAGFSANPECGFAYTDCAEVESDGSPVRYGENFAFGFGTYRNQMCEYRGKSYLVANNPPINTKTLSHIVGMPNHARAWTRSAYMDIGGHSADLGVADDYELLLRTFLKTRMLHVKHFGYVQHRRPGRVNTHLVRNREIQGQVAVLSRAYASAVQRRARELVGDAVQDVEFVSLNLDFQMNTQSIEGTKANE
jgi:glycosyltransferase involved in cell wall biosynthesis